MAESDAVLTTCATTAQTPFAVLVESDKLSLPSLI